MKFNPKKPFNSLPPLQDIPDLENATILKKCIEARSSLAELKQAVTLLPNPNVLINTLPILEAQASSEIENVVTTADSLFKALALGREDASDAETKEAVRYRDALYEGHASIKTRPLTTATAVQVVRTIKNVDLDVRSTPGTALLNTATGEVVYTPPEGNSLLRDLLADWERFLHERDDLDPLVRMAVGHYQFEAIHPFTDGNGRTGRILNLLYLSSQDLLPIPVLYMSRYIIQTRAGYYRLLLEVTRKGVWEEWILYMLDAVAQTSMWTLRKVLSVRDLRERVKAKIQRSAPKIYSAELVDQIFQQPYCRISNLVESKVAQRQTASVYLKKLAELNILKEVAVGRERIFINTSFFRILSANETLSDEAKNGGGTSRRRRRSRQLRSGAR